MRTCLRAYTCRFATVEEAKQNSFEFLIVVCNRSKLADINFFSLPLREINLLLTHWMSFLLIDDIYFANELPN